MQKLRYEPDPHNYPGFRKVLEGTFKLDKKNRLTYHVKAPVPRDVNVPHQLKLEGKWSLTKDHDLKLTLDKWGRRTFGDQLTLRGNLLDARKNSLLFALTERTKEATVPTRILKFRGIWQADKANRLTFTVKKEKSRRDILTLTNAWQIDKTYSILYKYEKARLIRKKKETHTLAFRGRWDIKDKARISYVIDRRTGSVFHFRPELGIFGDGYIKYKLGIGLSWNPRRTRRTITLSGRWKLGKGTGLVFQVRSGTKKKPIYTIKLSHKLLKGSGGTSLKDSGEAFLRAIKSGRELTLHAGTAWRF